MTAPIIAPTSAAVTRPTMNPWRLEWLRLTRTPRWVALLGVYLTFGLLGPVMATYLAGFLQDVQTQMTIIVPPPEPKDGIVNYVNQVGQTGLIVVVVIAAGALAFDARRGLSTFLRTRTGSMWQLVRPRITVAAAAAVLAYGLGTVAAWYGTALLLGPLPVGAMVAGLLCESLYLVFAVAVVAVAASIARSGLGTVGVALGMLILLSVLGSAGPLHAWLPSTLAGAPAALLTGASAADYLPAIGVTSVVIPALVAIAVARLGRREV
ncbi:MAG TPA: hypothetical protein VII33_06405 [Nakamurella sp.]